MTDELSEPPSAVAEPGADRSAEGGTVDVAADDWESRAAAARADGYDFFDWLSAYDDPPEAVAVVVRLWSLRQRKGVLLRTRVARDGGSLPTLTGLWAGADWHERETYEMFGVAFAGHPNLTPLLLPDGFEGNPLRKDFVLASRVAKAWPGAKESGEAEGDRPARRKMQPLGVPGPGEWGPEAPAGGSEAPAGGSSEVAP